MGRGVSGAMSRLGLRGLQRLNPLGLGANPGAGGGVLDAFDLTVVAATQNLTNETVYTFEAHALGAIVAGANKRYTVITVGGQNSGGQEASSITVGGLSASLVRKFGVQPAAAEIWICDTSSLGTSADIVVTWPSGVAGIGIATYRLINPNSATATDTDAVAHVGGVCTLTLDIPDGGKAVAVVQAQDTVLGSFAWTGTAEPIKTFDAETDTADDQSGALSSTTGAFLTLIATGTRTSPNRQHAVAASWGP